MFSEKIFDDLKYLENSEKISKMDLLEVLRQYANSISTFDMINLTSAMIKDTEYVPSEFFSEVQKVNVNFVFDMFNSIRDVNENHEGFIDKKDFEKSVDFLIDKYKSDIHDRDIFMFSIIGGLYNRFIIEKPIHPLDLPFPGNLKITHENGQYYCPARKNNLKNPVAFCKMCICRKLEF